MSSKPSGESCQELEQLTVEQITVGKHFRVKSEHGTLTINSSNTILGVWLSRNGKSPEGEQIGMVLQPNVPPYFCVYPKSEYWKRGNKHLPFALSADSLQVPHPDGTVTILPLEKLAALVKKLAE
jgi:hypothetical protein